MSAAGRPTILDGTILEMLAEARIGRLATITPRGLPHVGAFWYATDGERIVISTLANQTVRNLEASDECALLVDLGQTFEGLRGAHIRCRATLYRRADALPAPVTNLRDRIEEYHRDEIDSPAFARYLEWEQRDGVTIELTPRSATWFDLGRQRSGRTPATPG